MNYSIVTDEKLAQARHDPAFRQQLIAASLDHLLLALARLRTCENPAAPEPARQIRQGVQLAVRLAEILQRSGGRPVANEGRGLSKSA